MKIQQINARRSLNVVVSVRTKMVVNSSVVIGLVAISQVLVSTVSFVG